MLILQTTLVIFKSGAKVLLFFDMTKSFFMFYSIILVFLSIFVVFV